MWCHSLLFFIQLFFFSFSFSFSFLWGFGEVVVVVVVVAAVAAAAVWVTTFPLVWETFMERNENPSCMDSKKKWSISGRTATKFCQSFHVREFTIQKKLFTGKKSLAHCPPKCLGLESDHAAGDCRLCGKKWHERGREGEGSRPDARVCVRVLTVVATGR